MPKTFEVLFAPAEVAVLPQRDLSETVCVVFDILRATSTMLTALANGAREIRPVSEIDEALAIRKQNPAVLLAGERHGVRILADQTGSCNFDFGNSPREFTPDRVREKTIVMTTTNGTRALKACSSARTVLIGTFLGLRAVFDWIEREQPRHILFVCSGTVEQASYEDTLGAGALCDLVWSDYGGSASDSAQIARQIYSASRDDLLTAMQHARNGRRLLAIPELCDDVAFCVQRDSIGFVAALSKEGTVRKVDHSSVFKKDEAKALL
jgi:2-phosphosulfolactate phosphatase